MLKRGDLCKVVCELSSGGNTRIGWNDNIYKNIRADTIVIVALISSSEGDVRVLTAFGLFWMFSNAVAPL